MMEKIDEWVKAKLKEKNIQIDWSIRIDMLVIMILLIVLYYFAYREQIELLNVCVAQLNVFYASYGTGIKVITPYNLSKEFLNYTNLTVGGGR